MLEAGGSCGSGASSIAATFDTRAFVSPGRISATRHRVDAGRPVLLGRARPDGSVTSIPVGSVVRADRDLVRVVEQPVREAHDRPSVPSRWWPATRTVSPRRTAGCVVRRVDLDDRRERRQQARVDDDAGSRPVAGSTGPRESTGSAFASACAPRSARPRRRTPRSAGSAPGSPTTAATSPRVSIGSSRDRHGLELVGEVGGGQRLERRRQDRRRRAGSGRSARRIAARSSTGRSCSRCIA